MTAPASGANHELWSELAAGWALYALDAADEAAFAAHLSTCPRCQQDVAAHLVVAEHLSTSVAHVVGEAPEMPLLLRKELGLVQGPRGRATRSLRAVQRHRWATTAAAAVAALLVGGVTGVSLAGGGPATSSVTAASSSAAAQQAMSLGVVSELASFTGGDAKGRVAVLDGHGWLVAHGLPSVAASGEQYVVWQAGSDGAKHPMKAFQGADETTIVDLGPTVAADFAVSLERVGSLPAHPGTLVLRRV